MSRVSRWGGGLMHSADGVRAGSLGSESFVGVALGDEDPGPAAHAACANTMTTAKPSVLKGCDGAIAAFSLETY